MKNIYLVFVLIFFVVVFTCCSATLPKYLKTCRRDDPELNECIKEYGNIAIPKITEGDKRIKIPPLNPLHLTELTVIDSPSIKLKLTQVLVHGLADMRILNFDMDLEKKHARAKLLASNLTIAGHYVVNGHILILPIVGQGQALVNIGGSEAILQFDYEMVKKNNKEHMHLLNIECDFVVRKHVVFRLDNLFNGDKKLGEEMNKFLNDNGVQVIEEFKNPIAGTVNAVAKVIINGFFDTVPYDEFFSL